MKSYKPHSCNQPWNQHQGNHFQGNRKGAVSKSLLDVELNNLM